MAERPSIAGLASAAISTTILALYISLLVGEGESLTQPVILFFAGLIALAAVTAEVGSFLRSPEGTMALLGAALMLLPPGILGIFSIGLPLLIASALAAAGGGARLSNWARQNGP